MTCSIFYYKFLSIKDKLHKVCHRDNDVEKIYITQPFYVHINMQYVSGLSISKIFLFEKDTVYVAIKFKDFMTDSFFIDNLADIEVQCVRQIHILPNILYSRYPSLLYNTIYVDIIVSFLPRMYQLKKLKTLFLVSCNDIPIISPQSNGIYTLTFIRNISENTQLSNVLTSIRIDVEQYIPQLVLLFTEIYTSSWFCIQNNKS